MKLANNSPTSPAGSTRLTGSDPVVELMLAQGIPLTRANYVQKAGLEEPLEAEHEGYVQSLPLEGSTRPPADDPNRPETEEDGLRAGAQRLLKARHQSRAFMAQTPGSSPSPSPSNTPATTASSSDDEPSLQK